MNKLMTMVVALTMVLCWPGFINAADEMLQIDGWYEGPPPDPFNEQEWADYYNYSPHWRGDQLAVLLDTAPGNYPINIEQIDFLAGDDADVNMYGGIYRARLFKVGVDGLPGNLIWTSPSDFGFAGFQLTSSVYVQGNFTTLGWDFPTINEGPFILALEYDFTGIVDLCADNGVAQAYHENMVRYNPILHGGGTDEWMWVFAEDAGLTGKSIDHNFIIRAHVNHNVPPVYDVPATTPLGLGGLIMFFSILFGWKAIKKRH